MGIPGKWRPAKAKKGDVSQMLWVDAMVRAENGMQGIPVTMTDVCKHAAPNGFRMDERNITALPIANAIASRGKVCAIGATMREKVCVLT